jgi:hypothetical protein
LLQSFIFIKAVSVLSRLFFFEGLLLFLKGRLKKKARQHIAGGLGEN